MVEKYKNTELDVNTNVNYTKGKQKQKNIKIVQDLPS